jgi:HD superfamily phosphohydrolase
MNVKAFFYTLFWKQNEWHKYSVLRHTLAVTWHLIKCKQYSMIIAGLLHDIGKPVVAHQDEDDIAANTGTYSFTGHEEKSYQMIKNWKFISKETKLLVRHHYLLTGMAVDTRKFDKTKQVKYLTSYGSRILIWNNLSLEMQNKLTIFKYCDDLGKGYPLLRKAIPSWLEEQYNIVTSNY